MLTRSSHPSPLLAAHGLGKQAHVLILGQSDHARAHGETLLREIVYDDCHKVELAKEDPSRKRLRSTDVLTVPIMAPPNQSTHFFEVQADPAVSFWRAGIDLSCDDVDLEKAVVELCTKELDRMDLAVRDRHGCKQLVTTKALKEGQRVGNVTSLLFSTKVMLRDFLNKGGNVALADAPLLEIGNLETSDMLEGVQMKSVYSVPVGAGRLLTDYRHAKVKFPNVELFCCPELGPNDGFIQMRVKTHNQCGISADKALVLDFGAGWQLSTVGTSDAAKRFKGSLDCFWGKVTTGDDSHYADGECDGSPSKSEIGEPSPKKPRLTDEAALGQTTQEKGQPAGTGRATADVLEFGSDPRGQRHGAWRAQWHHCSAGCQKCHRPFVRHCGCDLSSISAESQQYLISISAVSPSLVSQQYLISISTVSKQYLTSISLVSQQYLISI